MRKSLNNSTCLPDKRSHPSTKHAVKEEKMKADLHVLRGINGQKKVCKTLVSLYVLLEAAHGHSGAWRLPCAARIFRLHLL